MSTTPDSQDPRPLPPGSVPRAHGGWGPSPMPPEPTRVYAYGPEEEVHLWDYWRVLVRHRWTVLAFFIVTVVVATVWTFTTKPVYTGTVTLRIEREAPKVLKFDEVVQADRDDDYYQTQYKILQSRSIANRVIGMLALDQHPEFQTLEEGSVLSRVKTWVREALVRFLPMPPPPPAEGLDDLVQESPLTQAFLDRLAVRPVRNARLVEVGFESEYPDLAARVANSMADAFIAQSLDQKVEATRAASRFLSTQLDETRAKLEEAEGSLTRFLQQNDILFVAGEGGAGTQDLVTKQLVALADALVEARGTRIEKEGAFAQTRGDIESLPAVLGNVVIGSLKDQLVKLEGEYRRLGEIFKPDYPRMRRIEQNIAEVRRQLAVETGKIVDSLEADYRAALRTEAELQSAVDTQRALVLRLGDQMAEYRLLRRDVDTAQGLYTSLLTRLKETSIAASLLVSNISVVDRAEVPIEPSRPRKALNLLLACVVGLFGGVGLAFFRDYLDTTIKDAKEVESVLRLPTLAVVPALDSVERHRARRRALAKAQDAPFALVAHSDAGSPVTEAFRNFRTSLLYSSPDHPPRTIAFTSLQPGDGKTSLATNLAIVLAQLGAGDVLLVDADMRKPRLHDLLEVPQTPGLSTFLTGQASLEDVVKPTSVPNLSVIPSGQVPLNPAELLASARLKKVMEDLGRRFVHVVFDAPPLFGVADAMVMAPKVEGVVLVLRHGRSSRDAAQRAVGNLAGVRARLLGVILNDVDIKGSAYYYQYYGAYGYGEPLAPASRATGADDGRG